MRNGARLIGLLIVIVVALLGRPPVAQQQPSRGAVKLVAHGYETSYSVLFAFFALTNDNDFAVKDIPISCTLIAPSGTIIGAKIADVYEIIPAHGKIEVTKLDLGPISQQVSKIDCSAGPAERLMDRR
jgi:hypothetical protein